MTSYFSYLLPPIISGKLSTPRLNPSLLTPLLHFLILNFFLSSSGNMQIISIKIHIFYHPSPREFSFVLWIFYRYFLYFHIEFFAHSFQSFSVLASTFWWKFFTILSSKRRQFSIFFSPAARKYSSMIKNKMLSCSLKSVVGSWGKSNERTMDDEWLSRWNKRVCYDQLEWTVLKVVDVVGFKFNLEKVFAKYFNWRLLWDW